MNIRITYYLSLTIFICASLITSCATEKKEDFETIKIDFYSDLQYEYVEVDENIKMAYLDIGNTDDQIVLLVHGEPNNSFVYRNIAI